MPKRVLSNEFIVRRKTTRYPLSTKDWRRSRPGFSLIEIALSLFLVLAILTILFATSGTYIYSRKSNNQTIATKIASREIENLKATNFALLPGSGSISDPDLAKLPSATATLTVANYLGNTDIKQITIKVDWSENQAAKEIAIDTLLTENGL